MNRIAIVTAAAAALAAAAIAETPEYSSIARGFGKDKSGRWVSVVSSFLPPGVLSA